jgi:hypothetical protein
MDGFTIIALILTALPTARLIQILYHNYKVNKWRATQASDKATQQESLVADKSKDSKDGVPSTGADGTLL